MPEPSLSPGGNIQPSVQCAAKPTNGQHNPAATSDVICVVGTQPDNFSTCRQSVEIIPPQTLGLKSQARRRGPRSRSKSVSCRVRPTKSTKLPRSWSNPALTSRALSVLANSSKLSGVDATQGSRGRKRSVCSFSHGLSRSKSFENCLKRHFVQEEVCIDLDVSLTSDFESTRSYSSDALRGEKTLFDPPNEAPTTPETDLIEPERIEERLARKRSTSEPRIHEIAKLRTGKGRNLGDNYKFRQY